MSISNTLCTHLWGHAVIDVAKMRVRACCKTPSREISSNDLCKLNEDIFLNQPYMLADRKEMLRGGMPSSCTTCWRLESKGIKSFRTGALDWENYMKSIGRAINETNLEYSFSPNNLDIQLDNYCDLKCIYCNQEFSSQWQVEVAKYGVLPYEIPIAHENFKRLEGFDEIFLNWFDRVKMGFERIAFLGGEPLISPSFYQYLEKIINSYKGDFPKSLNINIITNLNTPIELFSKFVGVIQSYSKKMVFNINISMEATDKKAEIIRFGLNYKRFKKNFEELMKLDGVIVSTITSVNLLSISSLEKYLDFLFSLEDKYNKKIILYSNIISTPEYLNLDLVHESFAKLYLNNCIKMIESRISNERGDFREYLLFLNSLKNKFKFSQYVNTEKHQNAVTCFKILEKRRNIDFVKIFPEYGYLFK